MALLGNYSVLRKSPGRFFGGSTVSPQVQVRSNFNTPGSSRNQYLSDQRKGFNYWNATPHGYVPPGSWIIAQVSGGLASDTQIGGSGSIVANLAGGLYATAALAGTSSVTANLNALGILVAALAGTSALSATMSALAALAAGLTGTGSVSAAIVGLGVITADLSGFGDITAATMSAVVSITADLLGSGTISSAAIGGVYDIVAALTGAGSVTADMSATGNVAATLAGTSSLTASLNALGGLVASLVGAGTLTADIYALGNMSADITVSVSDPLSPANLAAAVWNAVAASFNDPGTMGEKVNAAASAGDPWTTALPGVYAPGTAGDIIGNRLDVAVSTLVGQGLTSQQATMLLELFRLAGLDPTKPLVVTSTTRKVPASGADIDQTIVDAAGTVTVT
ncbi:MAG: hypothetical protein ABI632_07205, partial [Pseudolysinimonas sp.]